MTLRERNVLSLALISSVLSGLVFPLVGDFTHQSAAWIVPWAVAGNRIGRILLGPIVGKWTDKVGIGKAMRVAVVGQTMVIVAFAMSLSIPRFATLFLIARVLQGPIMGAITVAAQAQLLSDNPLDPPRSLSNLRTLSSLGLPLGVATGSLLSSFGASAIHAFAIALSLFSLVAARRIPGIAKPPVPIRTGEAARPQGKPYFLVAASFLVTFATLGIGMTNILSAFATRSGRNALLGALIFGMGISNFGFARFAFARLRTTLVLGLSAVGASASCAILASLDPSSNGVFAFAMATMLLGSFGGAMSYAAGAMTTHDLPKHKIGGRTGLYQSANDLGAFAGACVASSFLGSSFWIGAITMAAWSLIVFARVHEDLRRTRHEEPS